MLEIVFHSFALMWVSSLLLGILAAREFVAKHRPFFTTMVEKINPLVPWIGFFAMCFGLGGVLLEGFGVGLVFKGRVESLTAINWVLSFVDAGLWLVVGFLLAPQSVLLVLGASFQEKIERIATRFQPLRNLLGLTLMGTAVLRLVLHTMWMISNY